MTGSKRLKEFKEYQKADKKAVKKSNRAYYQHCQQKAHENLNKQSEEALEFLSSLGISYEDIVRERELREQALFL